ncbi:hypothetical protein JCM10450v2_002088 [Rhodotorula kratochvilovae]
MAFPSLGERFSSVSAFKLAAFRACLAHGVVPERNVGNSAHAFVRCVLTVRSTTERLNERAEPCSFMVGASGPRSGGGIVVNRVCAVHSCRPEARLAWGEEAREETQRKIETMEAKVAEEGKAAGRGARDGGGREEEDSESGGTEPSQTMGRQRRGPPRRARASNTSEHVSSGTEDESSSSEDGSAPDDSEDEVRYPSATQVETQVKQLLDAGDVTFPSSGDTFASASALLTRLYAYAQQRGFTLYRQSDAAALRTLRVQCSRGHRRRASSAEGCCSVKITGKEVRDGLWRVTASQLSHNHAIGPGTALRPGRLRKARPRKRARETSSESDSSSSDDDDNGVPAGPPVKTRQAPAAVVAGSASAAVQPDSLLGSPPGALSPPIPALLTAVFPDLAPAQIASMASTLTGAGVSTAEDLGSFLYMEGSSVELMDEDARRREGDFGRTWSFTGLQEALRGACGGS